MTQFRIGVIAGCACAGQMLLTPARLKIDNIACRRGAQLLFEQLTFDVSPGQIIWLRGQNGRGKTTLLKLAAGLARPDSGRLLRGGVPVRSSVSHHQQLVFIAHENALKEDLTVREALAFLLRIHGRCCDTTIVDVALDRLGLRKRRQAMVRTLSQGQRRRVALARLAVEDRPSLWLLDEPFDALDSDGITRVNALLLEHVQRGGNVLLTSHLSVDPTLHPIELDLDRYAAEAAA